MSRSVTVADNEATVALGAHGNTSECVRVLASQIVDLPVLLAGKLNGKFQTGYHFKHTPDTPMSNLLVTMLDGAGVPIEKLGDSTGRLLLDYSKV